MTDIENDDDWTRIDERNDEWNRAKRPTGVVLRPEIGEEAESWVRSQVREICETRFYGHKDGNEEVWYDYADIAAAECLIHLALRDHSRSLGSATHIEDGDHKWEELSYEEQRKVASDCLANQEYWQRIITQMGVSDSLL